MKKKKTIIALLMVILVMGLVMVTPVGAAAKSKKVKLSSKSVAITVGQSKNLKLKNASRKVKWKNGSKKLIKTLISGKQKELCKITGKKKGKTVITAVYKGKKYKCQVTVKAKPAVSLDSAVKIEKGATAAIRLKNNKEKVAWKSSNPAIVRIKSKSKTKAVLEGIKKGNAKVTAVVGEKTYSCKVTVVKAAEAEKGGAEYSYVITPLLPPFNEYFYVKTDNPDPSNIRFEDKSSSYYSSGDEDSMFIVPTAVRFLDVAYENKETGRVKGGYIFEASGAVKADGGELVLQKKEQAKPHYYNNYKYVDTNITVKCPAVKDRLQYLIDNYTTNSMTFFEKMDAVQSALNHLALYPRGILDTSKPNAVTPYPLLSVSPYPELGLNEWYRMYESSQEKLFVSYLYPYVVDSLGFPSMMWSAAQKLDPSCELEWGSLHYLIKVTKDGKTKTYGGAGRGSSDPLLSSRVEKLFLFNGSASDYAAQATLELLEKKRTEYGEFAEEDMQRYKDQIFGSIYRQTVAPASWIRVTREGFNLGTSKAYAYVTQGERFSDDIANEYVFPVEDVWVDGRYINICNYYEEGARFADHPNSDIMIRNMTYTDMKGIERTGDVTYYYDVNTDTWKSDAYTYGYWFTQDLEIPGEFTLTREQVEAMNVDKNTNSLPSTGFIYDGSAEPGTPF